MKALARQALAALGFVAIDVVVALGVVLVDHVYATHDPDLSYVHRGMIPYDGQRCETWAGDDEQIDGWHHCWHDDEVAGEYSAIDYNWGDDAYDDAGLPVRLMYTGDFEHVMILEYTGYCKGVRVGLYWKYITPGYYRGDIHYLHIDVDEEVIGDIPTSQGYYIGWVAWEDASGCSTAPHLHQSADTSPATPFYGNKFADPSQGYEWQHAVLWEPGSADSDGDGFINQLKLYIGTDPFDDCPDGTWDDAWPPDINNDTQVGLLDLMEYFVDPDTYPSEVGDPGYDNRFDLTADGSINLLDIMTIVLFLETQCT